MGRDARLMDKTARDFYSRPMPARPTSRQGTATMNDHLNQPSSGCDGRCDHCSLGEQAERAAADAPLSGWAMARSAAVYFLLPLIAAVVGAWLGRGRPNHQLLWGGAGLIAGMFVAGLYARWINRRTGVVR